MKIPVSMVAFVAAVLPATGIANAATSARTHGTCGPIPSQSYCTIGTDQFPGGWISVDVDLVKSSQAGDYQATWEVWDSRGPTGCEQKIWANAPAGSWTCDNIRPGVVSLTIAKHSPDHAHLGLRW